MHEILEGGTRHISLCILTLLLITFVAWQYCSILVLINDKIITAGSITGLASQTPVYSALLCRYLRPVEFDIRDSEAIVSVIVDHFSMHSSVEHHLVCVCVCVGVCSVWVVCGVCVCVGVCGCM